MLLKEPKKMRLNAKKAVIVFCFCLILGGVLWFQRFVSANILSERDTVNDLKRQGMVLESAVAQKRALLKIYRASLDKLTEYSLEFPGDNVASFSTIERILARNMMKIYRVNPIKSTDSDRRAVSVSCGGDYFDLLRALSDIRSSKMAMRLFSLTVKGQEEKLVDVEIFIETIMAGEWN